LRELRRNAAEGRGYRPFEAHQRATARRARPNRRRVDADHELRALIIEMLSQRWSPQQISRDLRRRSLGDPAMQLCHEGIYQALHQPGSALAPVQAGPAPPLAAAHRARAAAGAPAGRAPPARSEQPMLSIHDRPFAPDDRSEPGNWEGDLIVGRNQQSAIGTLVERTTRVVRPLHLPRRDADALHQALRARMGDLPPDLLRSITWDQGTEMARHLAIAQSLGAPACFCDSRSPWRRGSNENMNGLLDWSPKAGLCN
jgi:IS30 family transposase